MRKSSNGVGSADYLIGYGRPPKSTQFQPGQSGNRNGRPKGARNRESMARHALQRVVTVTTNGRRRKMSVREAAFLQLAERASGGDLKALTYLLSLEQKERPAEADPLAAHTSSERALEKVQTYLERRRAAHGDQQ
jgi:hypothetical protein